MLIPISFKRFAGKTQLMAFAVALVFLAGGCVVCEEAGRDISTTPGKVRGERGDTRGKRDEAHAAKKKKCNDAILLPVMPVKIEAD